MVEVSVILPSKDEEETIGICINKIEKAFDKYDILGEIIVSDNSQDETPIIAKEIGAKVITPDKTGYGYAYKYAFKHAEGEYIVMGDSDDTYDFMEMSKLLEPLKRREADLVIGSRFKGNIERGAMPWHHKWIGNPILTWFLNLFFKANVSDAHSGFRAIRRETLEKLDLKTNGMEFASEMIIEAVTKDLRIKEVPISYYKRKNENSKLRSFSDGWRHLKFMLINTPNYLFIYPGFFLLFAGLFLMALALLNINVGFMPGTHSIIAGSLLTTMGYQIILFGVFTILHRGIDLPKFFSLGKGGAIGALAFISGFIYVSSFLLNWVVSGFSRLPPVEVHILGYTLIAIGVQTFFSSFMLSIIAERNN